MAEQDDMATPVTRGELREELGQLEQRLERRMDLRMDLWGGALRADLRAELDTRFSAFAILLQDQLHASEQRLSTELARHSVANAEDLTKRITAVDDKHRDLPPRVAALEAERPASRRRRRD